jgi:acyl carrier protein
MLDSSTAVSRAERVRDIVQGLVNELAAGRAPRPVTLEAALDHDLGLGSLERVELLLRLESEFGVRLGDEVMANARTGGDLVRALDTAGPTREPTPPPLPASDFGEGQLAPATAGTLVDVLHWHATRTPDRVQAILRDDDGVEHRLTFGALWHDASAIALGLRADGVVKGDRVALLLRTERAFFSAYFGALLAGGVPVPLYPPFRADQIEEYAERQAAILRNADARVLLTFGQAERVARLLAPLAPSLARVTTAARLLETHTQDASSSGLRGAVDDLALIQYTSGSTGVPKGVALTHGNLLANVRAFGEALGLRPDDIGVSWLPLYHDMGLIGMWLGALVHGVPVVIMSPLAFLSRPSRWLHAFTRHRGTVSAAPNFAYDLCARKIPDADLEGLDLGSWRAALNGAEAVNPDTLARFTARFAPYGFRAEAMCPVYGLAEASLCLTVPDMGTLPRVDRIARHAFQDNRDIRPAAPGEDALKLVGCGRPVPGMALRIVDADGRAAGDRVEGRVQFRGPSATAGYYRNVEATAALFEDGWVTTGDLGYWLDGYLYLTGRSKDVIIAAGRNIHPQEVEDAVADVPDVRRGCVAAFGCYDAAIGTERLVVVAETRVDDPDARATIEGEAQARIVRITGVPADVVALVGPGTIPKTSSGKIRRSATRELYERGELERRRASAWRQWSRLIAGHGLWRMRQELGRGASWAFTTYLWALGVTAVLFLRLRLMLRRRDTGSAITRAWCRTLFRLGTFPVTLRGTERITGLNAAVYVANHASYMDALLLRAALPAHVRLAAKDRLLSYPVLGGLLRANDVVSIARGRESSAEALAQVVREGGSVAIFPEGTFVRPPGLLPFRLGAFRAAVDTARPIVPVTLVGTRRAWPDETWCVRRMPLEVVIGEPLYPCAAGWPEMVRLRDLAREVIATTTGEPAFQPHTPVSLTRAIGQG